MSDPKHPVPGDSSIDASLISPLVNTPKGTVNTYRKLRSGYKTAVNTILNLNTAMLSRAGIDPAQVTKLKGAAADYDYITTELLPAGEMLVEMLRETAQERGNTMALVIEESASQAKRRAKSDPNKAELLGAVEPILTYQSAAAEKAVKTKIKEGKLKPKPPKHPKAKPPPIVGTAAPAAAATPAKA